MQTDQIALQLYTVREAAKRDFLGTLNAVADMGYRAVELAGLHGVPAAQVRAALDARGVRAAAAHVGLTDLTGGFAAAIADCRALGCKYIVVPWVPKEQYATPAAAQGLAATLNALGREVRAAGMQLAYHNHSFEFVPLGETTLWDLLTAALDPELVQLEIDVYWVDHGGRDPAATIARHAAAARLIHLKDRAPDGADAPAGTGGLDWAAILGAARAAGVRWYITEQDHPRDPLADSATAYRLMADLAVS